MGDPWGGDKPEFHDYRCTNDAVMVASPFFIRQLRILDPKLYVQWDKYSKRWEIWRKPDNKPPFLQLRIQNQDRSYKELGADVLLKLQAGDPHRYSEKELFAYFDAIDDGIKAAKERQLMNGIEARTREAAWYMAGLRVSVPQEYEKIALPIKGPNALQRIGGIVHG